MGFHFSLHSMCWGALKGKARRGEQQKVICWATKFRGRESKSHKFPNWERKELTCVVAGGGFEGVVVWEGGVVWVESLWK